MLQARNNQVGTSFARVTSVLPLPQQQQGQATGSPCLLTKRTLIAPKNKLNSMLCWRQSAGRRVARRKRLMLL